LGQRRFLSSTRSSPRSRPTRRSASFDKEVLAETKRLVYVNSLPPDAEIVPEWEAFLAALGRLAAQERIGMLFERGFTNRVTSRHGSGTARTNSVAD